MKVHASSIVRVVTGARRRPRAGGVRRGLERFVSFDADEDDLRWPALAACMERHGAVDMVSTRFTKGEVRRAAVLELQSDWRHGYPQLECDMAYRSLT